MSDLIIKPSGTSANFKVQNPSGTDKIVMNSSGTITTGTLGSGVTFPAGHIIQTQFTQITTKSTQSFSATTDTAVDGLTVNITPHFNNSIIKLECYFMFEYSHASDPDGSVGFFFRNSTALGNTDSSVGNRRIGVGTANIQYATSNADSTPENMNLTFFDRPNDGTNAIAQITYKFGVNAANGGTLYINQTVSDGNYTYVERGCSYISATEIAQSGNGTITPAKSS